jgi:hypothetical protein
MAVVRGIKEKVHLPIYDSVKVKPEEQLRDAERSSTLKFFIDVQGKTKLETNLQSAGLLPHYNTFEARALRVVFSDLPPKFPEDPKAKNDSPLDVTKADGSHFKADGTAGSAAGAAAAVTDVVADIEVDLTRLMKLLKEARASQDGAVEVAVDDDDGITFDLHDTDPAGQKTVNDKALDKITEAGGGITLSVRDLELLISSIDDEKKQPPEEQINPNNGSGTLISKLIYNTVTSLFVGEKTMIQMPTWFFPSGAGAYSEGVTFISHGEPNPTATFRFAEPIFIDKQQNFRVEIEIPDADTLKELQKAYGPMFIWVVLDGYMTRDVQ